MDPQMMAILQFLMGGGAGGSMGGDSSSGLNNDFQSFTLGGEQGQGQGQDQNSILARAVSGFSPVNQNINYGNTVSRFFNQNPVAGSTPFTGASPLQAGSAGNNAVRSFQGHSSFMPTDFGSRMSQWT